MDIIFHSGKPMLNVEPHFLVMGIQKIRHPHMHNGFAMPTTTLINLRQFGEWDLLLPLSLNCNPNFYEDPSHTFKTKWLFCKCVGLKLSFILMIGHKMSIKEDILAWL